MTILAGTAPDIRFVNLGIDLTYVPTVAFKIFGAPVYLYAVCILIGVFFAYLLAKHYGKQDGFDPDDYFDFLFWALLLGIVGARAYYVIFSWDTFKGDILKIFNFRSGGLAIYGGIIASGIMAIFYSKKKNWSFFKFADTAMPSVLVGQIFGRWGNFFNREAFGGYSNNLLAMQLKESQVAASDITAELRSNMVQYMGENYIQVHPTFLYESLWNLGLLILLHFYRPYKKFDGEIFLLYFFGYGIGRFWIEGLRTDQLIFFSTGMASSRILSLLLVIISFVGIIYGRRKAKQKLSV